MDRDKIIARLQEHYDFLVNKGHEVWVCFYKEVKIMD